MKIATFSYFFDLSYYLMPWTWTNQDISIPFEDLKSVKNSSPMGGCMVWWLGGFMGGVRSNTKNFKNIDWIKIIQFCLKIYDL